MSSPLDLRGYALRCAIEDLLYEYASVLDDGALERWPEFFTDDALYEIVSRENSERGLPLALVRCEGKGMLMDRMIALKDVIFYSPRSFRHIIGNVRPRPRDTGEIEVQANFAVFQTLVEGGTELLIAGSYRDVVVADGDRLAFRVKRCVYDTTIIPNTVVYPL